MRSGRREYARPANLPSGFRDGVRFGQEISPGRGQGRRERDSLAGRRGEAAGGGISRIADRRIADAGGTTGRGFAAIPSRTQHPVLSTPQRRAAYWQASAGDGPPFYDLGKDLRDDESGRRAARGRSGRGRGGVCVLPEEPAKRDDGEGAGDRGEVAGGDRESGGIRERARGRAPGGRRRRRAH